MHEKKKKKGQTEWYCVWAHIQEGKHPLDLTDTSKAINHYIYFKE